MIFPLRRGIRGGVPPTGKGRVRMRRLKLRFEPMVKVLSDDQVNKMLTNPPAPDAVRDPARRSFLRTAARGAVLAVPGMLLASSPARAGKGTRLPQLHPGENKAIFEEILADETSHVRILRSLLNDPDNHLPTRPVPNFQNLAQPDVLAFVEAAATFENTGTGTYGGALFAIQQTQ